MANTRSTLANVVMLQAAYSARKMTRDQTIAGMVALGFAPAASAAVVSRLPLEAPISDTTRSESDIRTEDSATFLSDDISQEFELPNADLVQHVSRLRNLVSSRIEKCRGERILLTYDGSIFDRITHRSVVTCMDESAFHVLCCIRPCMSEQLAREVREFAAQNHYELVETSGKCSINFRTMRINDHLCAAISERIKDFFTARSGVYVTGSITPHVGCEEIFTVSKQYSDISLDFDEDSNDVSWKSKSPAGTQIRTVLLFHGFLPYEIVAYYSAMFDSPASDWHIPTCYVPCHYELDKIRVKALLEHCYGNIHDELRADETRFIAMRSSMKSSLG